MKKLFLFILLAIHCVLYAQEKWAINFYNETANHEVFIYADNEEYMPMSAKFKFKLENLTSSLANDEIVIIPARSKHFLLATIKPTKLNTANKFEYSTTFNFGNVLQEKFDAEFIYSLPFEEGKTHLVFQGYNGKLSHKDQFALDFNLKSGSKVFAARGGIVVEVVNVHDKNCADISCAKYNNRILIMHKDGTFGEYSHLQHLGTFVEKGDIVEQNQEIGFSGNTGYSSGPHLHFAVFINRIDGKRTFIKTLFKTSDSEGQFLEEGKSYTKQLH